MKIDAHQHYWLYTPEEYGWIDESMHPLMRDFLPPDVYPEMNSLGYQGAIAVQARQTPQENHFLLDLAARFDIIRGIVAWVDLRSSSCEAELESLSAHQMVKGVRHIVQSEPAGFLEDPRFLNGIALLERFGLTYDVLVFHHQLRETISFLRRFPTQKFVLDHAGKPSIREGERDPWRHQIHEIAKHENVFCKLSALVTEANHRSWTGEDLRFYAETILHAFGQERVMIGSDWPVCNLAGDYEQVMAAYESFVSGLSLSEQAQIFGDTASKFYGL